MYQCSISVLGNPERCEKILSVCKPSVVLPVSAGYPLSTMFVNKAPVGYTVVSMSFEEQNLCGEFRDLNQAEYCRLQSLSLDTFCKQWDSIDKGLNNSFH